MIFGLTEPQFSDLMVKVLCTGLILYMFFIIWRLAKDSKAGKYGTAVLFLTLGLGTLGFIFKEILVAFLMRRYS